MAKSFPSLPEIERFRVPLEPGERHLLDFLLGHLDDNYEIYVQPFLNGDRPDIVVVQPNAGVLVIEVKDWQLRHYENPDGGKAAWYLVQNNAKIRSPIAQVEDYKINFYNLHIGLLFERKIKDSKNFSIVQTAVYFHNESTSNVQDFCHGVKYTQLLGRDALTAQSFNALLTEVRLNRKSYLFTEDLYKSFKRFLQPPEHTPEMGKDIQYTNRQKELVASRAGSRQKVRGVAGCGKTKVMAGRAVAAYGRTKDLVLVLTFNLTLRNYIHDRISEVRAPFPWSGFEITNYHQFFKTQANNYGLVYNDLIEASDQEDFFEPVKNSLRRYKTILVDEVQDYKTEWLRLLVKYFLEPKPDGEFVVFGDEKQNIYGRQMGTDRFPEIPTIPGRWNELKESFRMETATFRIAKAFQDTHFQERYELDSDVQVIQRSILEKPGQIKYYDKPGISAKDLFDLIRHEILEIGAHPNDLVILAPTYEIIRRLEYLFRNVAKERTTHACETEEEYAYLLKKHKIVASDNLELQEIRRGRKLHFWPNAGTVKLSTIHSFKGWEAPTLILFIGNTDTVEGAGLIDELIYTALTRARKNIVVFDSTGLYRNFFMKVIDQENLA
ncbi:NERD domain-containing protein/DEAD/DEAH box helicase [[Phormidium] sp. ETS-05]|uniref:UvrD-helicase domain-containing protein n=1 Tax=[Phormidium] sp. ETS-05 TaxID=222819 RepID=UPI0018EEF280|nr:NERD domain-containing protein/DEAD/DEAH box helicase [[Phormidium] sp. ETS-05]